MPVRYYFYGLRKAIMSANKRISEADKGIEEKFNNCMKNAI